jgi:hypothetical protein
MEIDSYRVEDKELVFFAKTEPFSIREFMKNSKIRKVWHELNEQIQKGANV